MVSQMSGNKNLHQRLVDVMHTMGAVGKGGVANYGEKFAYHRIDDIDDKLRVALVEHGVIATIIEIRDRKLEHFEDVDKYGKKRITWYAECLIVIELVNADNPDDRKCIQGWGQGLDNSDKATGKAIAYAAKSAYLSAFHLRGQPDNEADNITRPAASASSLAESSIKATASSPNVDDFDSLPEDAQAWINAINQCDNIEDFTDMNARIGRESESLKKQVEPFVSRAYWSLRIRECGNLSDLNKVGLEIRKEPEHIQAPMRAKYKERLSQLKNSDN
jgi:hypothetical protein